MHNDGLRDSIKSMKMSFIVLLLCSILFLLFGTYLVEAMGAKVEIQQDDFTLKVSNNLIDLQSDKASIKDILNDLEKKVGIKVKIFDGVNDKKVTLNISSLSVYSLHLLLEKMGVENFAVVYDRQLASKAIYILPMGQGVDKFIEDEKNIDLLPRVVDHRIARSVAEDNLPKYYPGEWIYFHTLNYYDLHDNMIAYAHMYRRPGTNINTILELEASIRKAYLEKINLNYLIYQTEISKELSDREKKDKMSNLRTLLNQNNESLYKLNIFATVVTGATETSSLIQNYYQGIPRIFANKPEIGDFLKNNYPKSKYQLGQIIFFNPFDIRYEIKLDDVMSLVDWKTKKLEKSSDVKDRLQIIESRKARGRESMTPEEREKHDQGIIERKKENISRWARYMNKVNIR